MSDVNEELEDIRRMLKDYVPQREDEPAKADPSLGDTMEKKDEYVVLTKRESDLIIICQQYARGTAAGLPGHALMLIIDKLVYALESNKKLLVVYDD